MLWDAWPIFSLVDATVVLSHKISNNVEHQGVAEASRDRGLISAWVRWRSSPQIAEHQIAEASRPKVSRAVSP